MPQEEHPEDDEVVEIPPPPQVPPELVVLDGDTDDEHPVADDEHPANDDFDLDAEVAAHEYSGDAGFHVAGSEEVS